MACMNARRLAQKLLGLAVWAVPLVALAARTKSRAADAPPKLDPSVSFWPILVVLVALGGICVVAFKSARRTHLD